MTATNMCSNFGGLWYSPPRDSQNVCAENIYFLFIIHFHYYCCQYQKMVLIHSLVFEDIIFSPIEEIQYRALE